jgi:hypothetical protein
VELADTRDRADRAEEQLRRIMEEKNKAVVESARLQELVGSSQVCWMLSQLYF